MAPPQKKKPSASQIFASSKDLLKKRTESMKSKRAEKDREDANKSPVIGSQVPHPVEEEKEEEEDFGELEQINGYRFYAPDSKDNLVFDIDVSAMVEGARPTIKAATIEKLLERLTHENWPDPSLVNTFLLTYRTFTTAQEVIDLLVMRFNIPWPKDSSPELRERYNTAKRIPIRLRVFNVAKNWVDKYINDQTDPTIIQKFEALADLMIQDGMDKPGQALKRTIQRQREGAEAVERRMMSKPPTPYLPSNLTGTPTLMDYHPEEIARQLTLVEQKLFLQLKPWELLNQAWTGADKEKLAPNIISILQRESRMRLWVATDVVKQPTIETAAQHITQWIKIAEKCLNLNNFSAMVRQHFAFLPRSLRTAANRCFHTTTCLLLSLLLCRWRSCRRS
jgi:son of sevenless-like protein